MEYNPYLDLYTLMGQATEIKPSFYLGKVVSGLPELQIKLEDIILNTNDLMIDQWLLDRNNLTYLSYTEDGPHEHVDVSGNGLHEHVDASGNGLHKHQFSEPLKDILKVGDTVVLLPTDSRFIIISKVVSL